MLQVGQIGSELETSQRQPYTESTEYLIYFRIYRFNLSGDEAERNTEYLELLQLSVSTLLMVQRTSMVSRLSETAITLLDYLQ